MLLHTKIRTIARPKKKKKRKRKKGKKGKRGKSAKRGKSKKKKSKSKKRAKSTKKGKKSGSRSRSKSKGKKRRRRRKKKHKADEFDRFLIAGVNKEVHFIDMDEYMPDPNKLISDPPEEKEDDVLRPLYIFKAHTGWILSMIIHKKYMYTGSDDKFIKVWDLDTSNHIY